MSDNSSHTLLNVTTSLDILYGASTAGVSSFFLLLYIPVVLGFISKVDFTGESFTFRLMIYHSLSDILQLVCHLLSGLMLLLSLKEQFMIFHVIGAILSASWFLMLILTLTLTLHRFFLIVFERMSHFLMRPVYAWSVTVLNFSVWLFVFVTNLTLYGGMDYDFEDHTWYYDMDRVVSKELGYLDNTLMCVVCAVTLPLYLIMFAFIYWKKKALHRTELRVALQMFSYCLFTLFACLTWIWGYKWVPDDSNFLWFLVDILWPLWNGANAVLYLIFNRTLRSTLRTISVKAHRQSSTVPLRSSSLFAK